MNFSDRIELVKPSATLAITSKAKAMRASGEDVIILAAGEPDYDTPDIVKEAGIKAIRDGLTKYTPIGGTQALKEAICGKFKEENGLKYSPGEIIVSSGAKHALYNVLQVVCRQDDEVIIISPYWLSYPEMAKLAGARPSFIKTNMRNGFIASSSDVKDAITKKTRALIINSPSNPSGAVYTKDQLKEIAEVCLANNILMISDEIYEKIIFDGMEHVSPAVISDEIKSSTVVVNGVSKSYSMTGWRIGYAAGGKEIIAKMSSLQSHSTSNPCSISQAAALAALTSDLKDDEARNRNKFRERRDVLMELFSGQEKITPFNPQGAFYLFCDISGSGLDSITFAQRLLEEKKVAVIPGEPFGEDSFVRISFAASLDQIKEGAGRIKEFVSAL